MANDHADPDFAAYCRTGAPESLSRVFDKTASELLRVATHLVPDLTVAEDLVQETFLAAIEHRDSFDTSQPVLPWLLGVLANRARLHRRSSDRELDRDRLTRRPSELSPRQSAQSNELTVAVEEAIDKLPEPYRPVLNLHLRHGLSATEIALSLERSPGTVRSLLCRGMERLRHALRASFAVGMAGAMVATRGLAAVKSSVMEHAQSSTPEPSLLDLATPGVATPGRTSFRFATGWLPLLAIALGVGGLAIFASNGDAGVGERTNTGGPATESEFTSNPDAAPTRTVLDAPSVHLYPDELLVRARWAADDRPAAGILVSGGPRDDRSWLRERWVRTDGSGHARFRPTTREPWIARGDRGGEIVVDWTGGSQTIDLTVPAGVHVRGRVVAEGGTSVEGASVWLARHAEGGDRGVFVTRSAADGTFSLRHVQPGRILSAFIADRVTSLCRGVAGEIGAEVEIGLVVGGSAGSIRGCVRGVDGSPAAGAAVLVCTARASFANPNTVLPPHRVRSDTDGEFVVNGVPPGIEVAVWVRTVDSAVWMRWCSVQAAGEKQLAIQLQAGATVTGTVRDIAGRPREGVRIRALQDGANPRGSYEETGPLWAEPLAISDAAGRFVLRHVQAGRVELDGSHAVGMASTELQLTDGETRAVELTLSPGGQIRGVVVDPSGRPLPGWRVGLVTPGRTTMHTTTLTNEHGDFAFPELNDRLHDIVVVDPGTDRIGPPLIHGVKPGAEPFRIVVPRHRISTCTITGRVIDSSGKALVGAWVMLDRIAADGGNIVTTVRTDTSGEYRIALVPAGNYSLVCKHDRAGIKRFGAFKLAEHATRKLADARFLAPGTAAVEVTMPGGSRASIAHVVLGRDDEPWVVKVRLTNGKGHIEALQPGVHCLTAWNEEAPLVRHRFTIASGQKGRVRLDPPRGVPCKLRFDAARRRGVTLTWFNERGEVLLREYPWPWPPGARPAGEPVVWTRALLPGRYSCKVADGSGREALTRFEVRPGAVTAVIDIEMPDAR